MQVLGWAAVLLAGCGAAPGAVPIDAGTLSPRGLVSVQILAFNDFHGQLEPPSGRQFDGVHLVDAGGADHFAAHLLDLRRSNPNSMTVAAGDLIGASPLSSALFHDEPTIELLGTLGLDFASVGNHEFDEGPDELLRMQHGGCHPVDGCVAGRPFHGASFRYLSANVAAASGGTLFPAYALRSVAGVTVALVGLTLEETPTLVARAAVEGLRFGGESATVNALISELKGRGADAIVVLLHQGAAPSFDTGPDRCPLGAGADDVHFAEIIAALDPAVDVVVSGHTHAAYVCTLGGKLVTSASAYGRMITDLRLTVDPARHTVVAKSARQRIVTRDLPPLAEVSSFVGRYVALAAPLAGRVIGYLPGTVRRTANAAGESPLGDLIADAQLAATAPEAFGGAQLAFMNPGGLRADLSVAADGTSVTFGSAFGVQPFGNALVTLTLTGDALHALLEQQFQPSTTRILQPSSGFRYTYDAIPAEGVPRVDPGSMQLDGEPVDPAATYRVTVNSFLATGGDGFTVLSEGTNRMGGPLDIDALAAHLAQSAPEAPLALSAGGRVTKR